MAVAITTVIAFLIVYTIGGVLLATNRWNVAWWVSSHDLLHRSLRTWRAGGFMMAVSGPALLAFVVAEVLRS